MSGRARWLAAGAAALVLGAALVAYTGSEIAERKMTRTVTLDVAPIALVHDAAHLARGHYLYSTRGCADCHTASGSGTDVFNEDGLLVVSANLTGGAHSATAHYRNEDWVRTIRHGVKPNGRPVMIMPSEDYNRLTDDDLAALVVYVQQLAPVPGRAAVIELPLLTRLRYAAGQMRDAAEKIDHSLPPAQPVPATATVARGAYIANMCMSCHGAALTGGPIPGAPAGWPRAANLTPGPGSAMLRYPDARRFIAMLRSGRRPDGSKVSVVMPFASLRAMDEADLQALHAYLRTLAPKAQGQR